MYAALLALLALSSIRFGDAKQVTDLFNPGSALCGSGVQTKDKLGLIMTWAFPLLGLTNRVDLSKPILDFWEKLNFNTKKNCSQFKAIPPPTRFPRVEDRLPPGSLIWASTGQTEEDRGNLTVF